MSVVDKTCFAEMEQQGEVIVSIARQILTWARQHVTQVYWDKGLVTGSFVPTVIRNGIKYSLFALWTPGRSEFYFNLLRNKAPFNDEQRRQELVNRVKAIGGISLPQDAIHRQPTFPLTWLADEQRLSRLLAVYEWVIQEIQAQP